MKNPTRILISAGMISLVSGCVLRSQLKFEPSRMAPYVGESGQTLRQGQPLEKRHVIEMLAGPGSHVLDPDEFEIPTSVIESLFGRNRIDCFSFCLIADVQMEDRGTRFGACLTRFLDKSKKIETTVRGFYQDDADEFYLGFVLKAIRLAIEANTNIDFVIHLGDAPQVGRRPELEAFNEMIGAFLVAGEWKDWEKQWTGTWLQTPIQLGNLRRVYFYNLLGNHDLFILGNFTGNFPVRVPDGGICGLEGLNHGLGLTPPFRTRGCGRGTNWLGEGTACRGYYFVDRLMPDGKKARLIMLSTSEGTLPDPVIPKLQRAALYPSLSPEQFDWLQKRLSEAQTDPSIGAVLVFGHYPLMEVTVNWTGRRADRDDSFGPVERLLANSSKVVAYFCGHLHSGGPTKEHKSGDHLFQEYISPSVQEFPKSFGVASVRKNPASGKYYSTVEYLNLEDLIDVEALPKVEVSEDGPPWDQQTRLVNWLGQLAHSSTNAVERNKLLAKWCYASSQNDIQHDLRTDIGLCFNPKFKPRLLQEYSAAQALWVELKREPTWHSARLSLEQAKPGFPIAGVAAGTQEATTGRDETKLLNPQETPHSQSEVPEEDVESIY